MWHNLKIRLPTIQDEDIDAPLHTVEALPPSNALPYGKCHCVLIREDKKADLVGIQGTFAAYNRTSLLAD